MKVRRGTETAADSFASDFQECTCRHRDRRTVLHGVNRVSTARRLGGESLYRPPPAAGCVCGTAVALRSAGQVPRRALQTTPGPNQEDKMMWIVTIALAVVAFGLVKARRRRNAAAGTGHE
jgi:hypothetical protein